MQIIPDIDGEELVRETNFDIAVPVHVETFGGETKVFAYPSVLPLCETYAERFGIQKTSTRRSSDTIFCRRGSRHAISLFASGSAATASMKI